MKKLFNIAIPVFALAAGLFISCGAQQDSTTEEVVEEVVEEVTPNVVEIAISSADYTTLVAAVSAAGLVETLSGEGPFTIFAPTNAAFDALPEGTLETLLAEENIGTLTSILTFHVVAGNVLSSDLSDGQVITTLNGQTLTVSISAEGVSINGAKVIAADLKGSNGVIHVIDTVLLPN